MSKMNKAADSRSIAGRIASHWQFEKLWIYLSWDLFFGVMLLFLLCGVTEMHLVEEINLHTERSVTFDTAEGFSASLDWLTDFLLSARYNFGEYSVDIGEYVFIGTVIFALVIALQLIMWAVSWFSEYFKAKSMLQPLNKIAFTATELTEKAHRNSYSFDDIESAIDRLNPMTDVHISTGNRDLKRLEDAINDMLDRMRAAYNSQARFVSDAAHELRTPIAVIKGYADMLDRWGKTDEKVLEEGIEAIRKESESMNNLVEQLLFLARGDNGRQQLTIVDFSLSDMMREVLSKAEMIDSDHEYIADIRDEVSVSGDVAMLKQTARILCDNAKKYTPKGNSITLRVKYNALGQPAFEVQDMGIGIDEKDIPKIFDRFYRSDSSRTRGTGGTGLGLSIAKWIVDRHGGHFEVISYKDIGTRMTVVLPGNNFCNTTK